MSDEQRPLIYAAWQMFGGFSRMPNAIWRDAQVKPAERYVFLFLCQCVNRGRAEETGQMEVWPGQRAIAEQTGYGRNTVNDALKQLGQLGYLIKVAEHTAKSPAHYLITIPERMWPPIAGTGGTQGDHAGKARGSVESQGGSEESPRRHPPEPDPEEEEPDRRAEVSTGTAAGSATASPPAAKPGEQFRDPAHLQQRASESDADFRDRSERYRQTFWRMQKTYPQGYCAAGHDVWRQLWTDFQDRDYQPDAAISETCYKCESPELGLGDAFNAHMGRPVIGKPPASDEVEKQEQAGGTT